MPQKIQLHNKKGKVKSFPKAIIPSSTSSTSEPSTSNSNEDPNQQYEIELCWCIQQLESILQDKNLAPKLVPENIKLLNVLKSADQPKVKKRQLMRMHFGDYRSRMKEEEKKSKKVEKVKLINNPGKSTSKFLKKSSFLQSTDNSFRFNFDPKIDESNSLSTKNGELDFSSSKIESPSNITQHSQEMPQKLVFTGADFKFNFHIDENS